MSSVRFRFAFSLIVGVALVLGALFGVRSILINDVGYFETRNSPDSDEPEASGPDFEVIYSGPSIEGQSITVYSGRNEALIGPLIQQFVESTGADVEVRYGNSTDLALLIEIEGQSTPADVFISQSPGAIEYLSTEGLLTPLPNELIEAVPAIFKGEGGDWAGLSGRRRVLVYNTELVDVEELPSSVLELTDARFAGRVAIAPGNSSFQDFVTLMRLEIGDDPTLAWLEGMAANNSPTYAKNSAIVDAVVRGEVDMGLVNHYYMLRYRDESPGAPGDNHLFADDDLGSAVLVTGVGILDDGDLNDAAPKAFIEFMLSEGAQEYYFKKTREYPVKLHLAVPAFLHPLPSEEDAQTLHFTELADGLAGTQDLIDRSGFR